ncbi:MAG: hypothetical protein ABR875_04270 [Minisyncoccia bacterium]|jgi:hypothetical protein
MNILIKGYKAIFGKEPEKMESWELAREIINNFDVSKMGEELAREVIFEVANRVNFPTTEMTREIVGHAENLATELFDELNKSGKEPHMAEIEHLEFKKNNKKM